MHSLLAPTWIYELWIQLEPKQLKDEEGNQSTRRKPSSKVEIDWKSARQQLNVEVEDAIENHRTSLTPETKYQQYPKLTATSNSKIFSGSFSPPLQKHWSNFVKTSNTHLPVAKQYSVLFLRSSAISIVPGTTSQAGGLSVWESFWPMS